jgi:hypothetical protein
MAVFDFNDLLADLEPLAEDVTAAVTVEERMAAFCEMRDRLIDHFEAVEPTLYAALRRFAHLALILMEADRARDDIRLALTSLSLLPPDSDAWIGMFVALEGGMRRYFGDTEARLVEIAGRTLGEGELRRLGVEANRIRGVYAAEHSGHETVGE